MAAGSISENKFQELAAEFENISRIKNDMWELRRLGEAVFLVKKILQEIPAGALREELVDPFQEEEEVEEEEKVEDTACLSAPPPSKDEGSGGQGAGGDKEEVVGNKEAVGGEVVTCEYHVVYSASYQVPVLYFNITRCVSVDCFTFEDFVLSVAVDSLIRTSLEIKIMLTEEVIKGSTDGRRLSLEEIWECVPQEFRDTVHRDRWSTLTQQEHPLLCVPFFQLHPCHTAAMMRESGDIQPAGNYLVKWLSAVGPVVGLRLPLSFGLT